MTAPIFIAPVSTEDCQIRRADSAVEQHLVLAFARIFGKDEETCAVLQTIQPYHATVELGPKQRKWDVHLWALPGLKSNMRESPNNVSLCMHGHGSTCCVTSWGTFFAPLHRAGFDIIAMSAPCFGRSSGSERETAQANLWRRDDAALVVRVLRAFGVSESPHTPKCTVLAQCMGAAMFFRALATDPALFGPHHVLSNATIGAWPVELRDILRRKGGKLLAFHEVDPDHMREAVAYRELSKLMREEPALCTFIDNANARERRDQLVLDCDHVKIEVAGEFLSREKNCFCFCPTASVSSTIMEHLTACPRSGRVLEHPGLQGLSAVEMGRGHDNNLVTVFVRLRPPLLHESDAQRAYRITETDLPKAVRGAGAAVQGSRITVTRNVGERPTNNSFVFNNVLRESAGQEQVWETVAKPLLDYALTHKTRATLFAYGQTGSGKTHTIGGSTRDEGVIPRLIRAVYARCPGAVKRGDISFSYVELYNEVVQDLLHESVGEGGAAPVRLCKPIAATGGKSSAASLAELAALELADATLLAPASAERMVQAWSAAAARRATGATQMNCASSRSHALFTVTVCDASSRKGLIGQEIPPGGGTKFHVVDLAGSERLKRSGAAGARLAESVEINTSLLVLIKVVSSLVSRTSHVPYRESLLTRLLANALGGASRTALVACISPGSDSAEESVSTLRFAACASHVENKLKTQPALAPETELTHGEEEVLVSCAADTSSLFDGSHTCFIPATGSLRNSTCKVRRGESLEEGVLPELEVFGEFRAGPSAPVILLLHYYGHGSPGGKQFLPWFRLLSEAGYRCLAPSFPGHGNTSGPAPSSKPDPDALAGLPSQVVTRVLDYFGVSKAVLLGHDWGGGVAIEYALRKPERVMGLVGFNVSYRDAGGMAQLGRRYMAQRKARRLLMCWEDSPVHLRKKGTQLAQGAGVALVDCNSGGWEAVLQHTHSFLSTLLHSG